MLLKQCYCSFSKRNSISFQGYLNYIYPLLLVTQSSVSLSSISWSVYSDQSDIGWLLTPTANFVQPAPQLSCSQDNIVYQRFICWHFHFLPCYYALYLPVQKTLEYLLKALIWHHLKYSMFFNIYRCCLSQLCIAIILAIAYYRVPFSKILIRCNTISIVQASFGDQTASRISVCLIIQLFHLRYCHRFIYLEIIHFFF